jgi:hypothetical protein
MQVLGRDVRSIGQQVVEALVEDRSVQRAL